MRRASGISVPLFSLITSRSWGLGEFPDLVDFAHWATRARQSVIQILPVMELPEDERSPYSALTSFALDPVYIALPRVVDFEAIGGEVAFETEDRLALEEIRRAPTIPYREVRQLKHRWLRRAWERFVRLEIAGGTPRARAFDDFCQQQAWWLDDYAVFRATLARHENLAWWDWPEALRPGDEPAFREARRVATEPEIGYRKYLQWLADAQWREARRLAWPARIFGDLPFMISANSADVWRRQPQFRLDATVGAPPDAFAPEGQDWGLPPWQWQAFRSTGFEWMHQRARRHADLFDGFRIDHLVGLYRAWIRPMNRELPPFFDPDDEPTQRALGEAIIGVFKACGAELIAEDLGTVPDFVRESITALGVPGFKVLRWERHGHLPGEPFIDPATFPELSVATTGTHDIDPLAAELTPEEVDEALADLMGSGSYLALVPLQDVFAWRDRINTPSEVGAHNWTWRVPLTVDAWPSWAEAVARQARLGELARAAAR